MLPFNDFINKYKLKKEATSNMKIYQVFSCIGLNNVGKYLQHGPFSSDTGTVTLHPSNGTRWVFYLHESYFDSCGCSPTQTLSAYNIN